MKRWPTTPLGELVSLEYGKALKAEERLSNGRFFVFGSNGIVGAFDRALVSEPTIVVGRKGAIGEVHLTENGCWPIDTAFYTVLRERNTVSLRFLLLWFRSVDLKSLAITSTIPGLNRNTLYSQPVPVPPLTEQERIVKLLDEADELRKQRAQADSRTAALIPALFHDMFGDPSNNSRGWKLTAICEMAEVQGGLQVTSLRDAYPQRRPYLRVANVQRGFLILDVIKEIGLLDSEYVRVKLAKGDLLLVEGNGNPNEVGRAAIWDGSIEDCVHQNHLIRVRPSADLLTSDYLLAFVNSESGRSYFHGSGNTTSGLVTISTSIVKNCRIPLPPLALQKEFAARVSEIRAVQAEQSASRRRLENLFQSILHRAFQGEL